jgi:hypothetical protein
MARAWIAFSKDIYGSFHLVVLVRKRVFSQLCLKGYSIACLAKASNAKTQEKPQDQEILSLSWYTHHIASVGTGTLNREGF